jgi:hypothetical protein
MALLGPVSFAIRIGDQAQVGEGPSQPWRVQLPSGFEQDRLSLGDGMGLEVVGAISQHRGMGRGDLPIGQCLSGRRQWAAEHRSGGPHRTMGNTGPHAGSGPQPTGRGGGLDPLLSPSSTAAVDGGQLPQPAAFEAIHEPSQLKDPFGQDPISQPVGVLGGEDGELVDDRGQPGWWLSRMCVRVHGGNLSTPHPNTSTCTKMWTLSYRQSTAHSRPKCLAGAGGRMPPQDQAYGRGEGRDPPCQVP